MQVQGSEPIGDHEAYVVVGQREGKPPRPLYFDQQSGLLVRLVRYGDTALGLLPTQIDYADYRDTNGVKIPYRWTLARPSGRFTIQVTRGEAERSGRRCEVRQAGTALAVTPMCIDADVSAPDPSPASRPARSRERHLG